jgi:hypothetical protein
MANCHSGSEIRPLAPAIRQRGNDSSEHALKVGDTVAVFSLDSSGPSIEGTGIIESYATAPDRYHIKFSGERVTRLRFIHPDWQADPERSLALLREFWRSNRIDNPRIEDFFPDNVG